MHPVNAWLCFSLAARHSYLCGPIWARVPFVCHQVWQAQVTRLPFCYVHTHTRRSRHVLPLRVPKYKKICDYAHQISLFFAERLLFEQTLSLCFWPVNVISDISSSCQRDPWRTHLCIGIDLEINKSRGFHRTKVYSGFVSVLLDFTKSVAQTDRLIRWSREQIEHI